jgi:hypothetical protein
MQRECLLSGIIVLLAASGAWAVIGQAQGFEIGATNFVPWGGGVGSAQGSHQVRIGQEQRMATSYCGPVALQKETGVFIQRATASGAGSSTVRQKAEIEGAQGQIAGDWSQPVHVQGQHMGVGFTTRIDMPSGSGAASGTQRFLGDQTQTVLTPAGRSTESQVLRATEYAAVVGGPNADPTVKNSLNVQLSQGQLTGVPGQPKWGP